MGRDFSKQPLTEAERARAQANARNMIARQRAASKAHAEKYKKLRREGWQLVEEPGSSIFDGVPVPNMILVPPTNKPRRERKRPAPPSDPDSQPSMDFSENLNSSNFGQGSPQPEDLKSLKTKALVLWNKDESHSRELGTVLLKIKTMSPHGEFKKWWTGERLSQARVSYCLRLAAPEGNKVKASKEKEKQSPRTKALRAIKSHLAELYDLVAANGDQEAIKNLFDDIVEKIKQSFLAAAPKKHAVGKTRSKTAGA